MKVVVASAAVFALLMTSACNKDKKSDAGETADDGNEGGGGGGGDDNETALDAGKLSLAAIPDLGGLVQNNSTSLALAVAGTAPKMSAINSENYDQIMFGGAIAAVNAGDSVSEQQRGALQRGESVCRNIGESANVFRELGGGTLCYMSKVPSLSSTSITIDKEGLGVSQDDYSGVFLAGDTTKLVKINVQQPGGELTNESFSAMIKIYGKDTIADGYKVDFVQCSGAQVAGVEQFVIDAAAGTFSAENLYEFSEGEFSGKFKRSVSATLKPNGDGVEWDLTQDRVISNQFVHEGSWGSNLGNQRIVIDGSNFLTQFVFSSSSWSPPGGQGEGGSGSSKIWAKTAFDGADAKGISLPEMALRMSNTSEWNDQTFTDEVTGAVEWQTDTYADTSSSDLFAEAEAFDFSSDTIFEAEPKSVTIDYSAFDCASTPDVELTFDMTTSEAGEVASQCGDGGEGDSLRQLYELCNSQELQTARQKMWQHHQP